MLPEQRDALIAEIAETMEKVLNGLNNLNRGLEGVTTVRYHGWDAG